MDQSKIKTVTREGMQIRVLSSRERMAEHGGRHFFFVGRDKDGWTLWEHDQDIKAHGSAIPLGRRFERLLDTKALVAEIRRLVDTGEALPTDIRPPWDIDEARYSADQAALVLARLARDAAKPKYAAICSSCYMVYPCPAKQCAHCGAPKDRTHQRFKLDQK